MFPCLFHGGGWEGGGGSFTVSRREGTAIVYVSFDEVVLGIQECSPSRTSRRKRRKKREGTVVRIPLSPSRSRGEGKKEYSWKKVGVVFIFAEGRGKKKKKGKGQDRLWPEFTAGKKSSWVITPWRKRAFAKKLRRNSCPRKKKKEGSWSCRPGREKENG